ncbi:MAG: asparagine--tRNA ligase, partial [Prevotella buccalis]|nr:asparagine--tRNA ligase [Hoylesella buccalis]
MKRTKIVDVLKSTDFGKEVVVKGWVRTHRSSKAVDFIALNDGSTIKNIQIVVDPSKINADTLKSITTGACLCVTGTLVESQGKGQSVEIQCKDIEVYGLCGSDYPMQKKGQSFEYMRQHAHMRLRTNTFGAVMRIRHNMAFAIHQYFHEHGFFYFHTPLITASDAEGAGEMFQVTTQNLNDLKKGEDGKVCYEDDFFGKMTSLTVSGQLEGELGATALGQIYTFGPTFRAENSNTPRHLAEFWMIEPEIAFIDLPELMDLEEDFIKYCVRWALDNCKDDLDFLNSMIDKTLLERLQGVLKNDFVRLTYTDGIKILEEAAANGHKFEFPVSWGMDLASEHERFLVEHHFKKPVIMYDYPKEIKAFYMKINEDGKTVQGTDVLFPQIGEIIGGSVREENLEKLTSEIERRHIPMKDMWWYLDTRKYGTCPHGGFGLGFERLILFVTGMQNIRDVI